MGIPPSSTTSIPQGALSLPQTCLHVFSSHGHPSFLNHFNTSRSPFPAANMLARIFVPWASLLPQPLQYLKEPFPCRKHACTYFRPMGIPPSSTTSIPQGALSL